VGEEEGEGHKASWKNKEPRIGKAENWTKGQRKRGVKREEARSKNQKKSKNTLDKKMKFERYSRVRQ